jgi:hypothetical protein
MYICRSHYREFLIGKCHLILGITDSTNLHTYIHTCIHTYTHTCITNGLFFVDYSVDASMQQLWKRGKYSLEVCKFRTKQNTWLLAPLKWERQAEWLSTKLTPFVKATLLAGTGASFTGKVGTVVWLLFETARKRTTSRHFLLDLASVPRTSFVRYVCSQPRKVFKKHLFQGGIRWQQVVSAREGL